MADSIFEFVAAQLEQRTELDKLEARGTLRIALKNAGLEPRNVTADQMAVLLTRAMPKELTARGVERADEICQGLATGVKGLRTDQSPGAESPEDVFRRLGAR